MRQQIEEFHVSTQGPGATDLSDRLRSFVAESGIATGLLSLCVAHTSASLVVQENADPQVLADMENFLQKLVPRGHPLFRHRAEGPDDMPAHLRSALTSTTLSIPVVRGALALGTWQAVYLWEHRDHAHERRVVAHLLGE